MKCGEFRCISRDVLRQQWLNDADKAAAGEHARDCAQCGEWLRAERALSTALADLRVLAFEQPSLAVETAVMAVFRQNRTASRWRGWMRWAVPAAAAAMLFAGLWWGGQEPEGEKRVSVPDHAAGFIPVRYGAPVRAYENLQVMRVDLPRAELLRLGLPIGPEGPAGSVAADVLLGEDGLVKGIRFVRGHLELESKGAK